ncbi:Crp/Fnr family transcriptional regulator [Pseudalkalibacillus decolorationis]|uniref:Crp/Fnr family transcriptional regulator n=1 Tax=Pseudalkalibacillus decolorationis TaxID=163879 RepID=UPI002147FCEA|nr:Crp/Fnr family transcriptional regulator [Pseudalkalibacillus decolorationis]
MHEIKDQEQISKYLTEHQLETVIPEPLRLRLALYQFEKGEKICSQGEPIEHLYILLHGKIKVYTSSVQGKILVLCFKKPLEAIGDIEYIRKSLVVNTVESVSRSHVLKIPYSSIDKHGANSVPMLQFLLKVITEKFHIDSNFTNFNMLHPVETRLASYLLSVSSSKQDEEFVEDLHTSNMVDLANLLGTSYRHLNRVIHKMISEKWIERQKGYITIVNRESLINLADPNLYE